jgi:hypothetical protein
MLWWLKLLTETLARRGRGMRYSRVKLKRHDAGQDTVTRRHRHRDVRAGRRKKQPKDPRNKL